jgi:selenide,water dikinase
VPGGTTRNWESYGHKVAGAEDLIRRHILADPQTSGGLMVAVEAGYDAEFQQVAAAEGFDLEPFGFLVKRQEVLITIL